MPNPPDPTPHAGCAHTGKAVSDWVRRWAHLVRPGARLLDLACGHGRHARWFAARGVAVTGLDRDASALAALADCAQTIVADLEGNAWPLGTDTFDAVVVTNYLWRPLIPSIAACMADGGVLIYETFAIGNERFGKPSNPAFLLRPGELLEMASAHGLRVVAYEDGTLREPDRVVQRIVAVREAAPSHDPVPCLLDAS
jgi:SAM-dependent methyltransferase